MKYKTQQDINNAKEVISCPGVTLLETIKAKGISQSDLALRMGRPLKTINEIIMGKAAITPETAIQLERVIGPSAAFWLNYEKQYRLDLAEIAEAEKLMNEAEWLLNFPLLAMKKLQWIDFENTIISKMEAILSFLSISGTEGFEPVYQPKFQYADFRTDSRGLANKFAIASWLRKGELQASELNIAPYSASTFKENLKKIKSLSINQPDDLFAQLTILCNEAGVKVVHTPCLPGATLHGSTHWEKDTPVIQLSNRYKRNDIFWFTFFHEAGHILKHGKKATFIEGLQHNQESMKKEKEADEVAIEYTLTIEQETEIRSHFPLSKPSQINQLATKFNTHPACIMGRFARSDKRLNQMGWTLGFFKKIELE